MQITVFLNQLKKEGYRMTKIRKFILDLLINSRQPLSVLKILEVLSLKKIYAHKTTVYRELKFLKGRGVIRELQLGDNAKKYEIISPVHHHHIICVNCEKIENVVLENDLAAHEKIIAKQKKFKVLSHALEFFGLCAKCR